MNNHVYISDKIKMNNTESTNRERASMVSSSSKRFSSIGFLYTVVFFKITLFGTAKVQNYIKLSSETSDYQFVNFWNIP